MHSMWKATRPLLALAAFFFAMTGALNAQTSGKIEGRVFDAATNQPLAGAQVVVVGTGLGNLTNRDGYYFINNVPAGVRDIRAQYIGYQTVTVTATRVLAGQTARVDFRLPTQAVELEAITVQGEANPLVPRADRPSAAAGLARRRWMWTACWSATSTAVARRCWISAPTRSKR